MIYKSFGFKELEKKSVFQNLTRYNNV